MMFSLRRCFTTRSFKAFLEQSNVRLSASQNIAVTKLDDLAQHHVEHLHQLGTTKKHKKKKTLITRDISMSAKHETEIRDWNARRDALVAAEKKRLTELKRQRDERSRFAGACDAERHVSVFYACIK